METWIIVAIDPICGMTVDEATARSAEKVWRTYYFCSDQCRQKFPASLRPRRPHLRSHRRAPQVRLPHAPGSAE